MLKFLLIEMLIFSIYEKSKNNYQTYLNIINYIYIHNKSPDQNNDKGLRINFCMHKGSKMSDDIYA